MAQNKPKAEAVPEATTPASQAAPQPAPAAGSFANPFTLLWDGWKALGTNVGPLIILLVGIAVLLGVSAAIVIGLIVALHFSHPAGFLIIVVVSLLVTLLDVWLGSTLGAAYFRVALANARGKKVELKDVWDIGKQRWWVYFVASLLTGLAVIGGLILLIVPGIIFGVWFSLTSIAVVDGKGSAVAAMKHSRALLRGHWWEMFVLLVVIQVVAGVLQFIPLIGPIAAILLSVTAPTAYALRYLQLTKLNSQSAVTA